MISPSKKSIIALLKNSRISANSKSYQEYETAKKIIFGTYNVQSPTYEHICRWISDYVGV